MLFYDVVNITGAFILKRIMFLQKSLNCEIILLSNDNRLDLKNVDEKMTL